MMAIIVVTHVPTTRANIVFLKLLASSRMPPISSRMLRVFALGALGGWPRPPLYLCSQLCAQVVDGPLKLVYARAELVKPALQPCNALAKVKGLVCLLLRCHCPFALAAILSEGSSGGMPCSAPFVLRSYN